MLFTKIHTVYKIVQCTNIIGKLLLNLFARSRPRGVQWAPTGRPFAKTDYYERPRGRLWADLFRNDRGRLFCKKRSLHRLLATIVANCYPWATVSVCKQPV